MAAKPQPNGTPIKSKGPGKQASSASINGETSLIDIPTDAELDALGVHLEKPVIQKCRNVFGTSCSSKSGEIPTDECSKLVQKGLELDEIDDSEFREMLEEVDHGKFLQQPTITFADFLLIASRWKQWLADGHGKALSAGIDDLANSVQHRMAMEREPMEERVEKGVIQAHLIRYLRSEINEEESCEQLPCSMALFIIYALVIMFHEKSHIIHTLEKSIDFDLKENANFAFGGAVPFDNGRMGHKSLEDVNSIADFWSWMNMGLTPLLFREEWDVNEVRANVLARCGTREAQLEAWAINGADGRRMTEMLDPCPEPAPDPLPVLEMGMYLYYNRLLGGVQLLQERSEEALCQNDKFDQNVYGQPCFKSPYYLEPEMRDGLANNPSLVNRPGGETLWLFTPSSQAEVKKRLREWEDRHWFAPATQKVQVSFITFNAIEGALTQTFVNIFVTRGGHFWKQTVQVSVWTDMFSDGWHVILVDIIWGLFTLRIFLLEGWDVLKHWKYSGIVEGSKKYIGIWNFIDWVSVVTGCLLALGMLSQYTWTQKVVDVMNTYDPKIPGGWEGSEMEDKLNAFVKDVTDLNLYARNLRLGMAIYPFVIALRLFKSFAAQPRLALVTETLYSAATDVLHFGVVFLAVFLTYAASGMCLFGREMEEFSTYVRSINMSMRCLLGDFDWEAMRFVGREEAGLWFWSFNILTLHIMFNMLLSIVMDTYMEVKGRVGGQAETLASQAREIYRRWLGKRRRERIGIEDILHSLDPSEQDMGDEEEEMAKTGQLAMISVSEMCKQVSGLTDKQARRLLIAAETMVDMETRERVSLSDAMQRIQATEDRAGQIHQSLEEVIHLSSMMAQRQSNTFKRHIENKPRAQSEKPDASPGNAITPSGAPSKLELSTDNHTGGMAPVPIDSFENAMSELNKMLGETLGHCSKLQQSSTQLSNSIDDLNQRLNSVEQKISGQSTPAIRIPAQPQRDPLGVWSRCAPEHEDAN